MDIVFPHHSLWTCPFFSFNIIFGVLVSLLVLFNCPILLFIGKEIDYLFNSFPMIQTIHPSYVPTS